MRHRDGITWLVLDKAGYDNYKMVFEYFGEPL